MVRNKRISDLPEDPAATLRILRQCRNEMTRISVYVRIGSLAYAEAAKVTRAIDGMAHVLTGNPEYFWLGAAVGGGQSSERDSRWAAIERGDLPWPQD